MAIYTNSTGQQVYDFNGATYDAKTGQAIGGAPQAQSLAQIQATAANQGQPGYDILGNSMTPASQTPPTPAPTQPSPAAPTATTSTTTGTPTQQGATQQGQLTMPANGSVVDLLNMAGMDSSQAARKQMAQQYGIQNYDFSAAKNQELAAKFLEQYNKNKDTAAPQSGAEFQQTDAYSALQKQDEQDPQASFMESYFSMNPVLKTFYDTMAQAMSTTTARTSLVEEYQKMYKEELGPLQTELMDINRIMEGTEDDIREEIAGAGGFGTESQIQAMTMARNKTLLKRATALEQTLQNKQDYVNQIIQLTGMDREQVDKDLDRKLGIAETMFNTFNQMQNAAAENYRSLVQEMGYDGLAAALESNPKGQYFAEMALGLPSGALTDPDFLAHANRIEWSDPYSLGGDLVQRNYKTGEIRTAVNVAAGSGGGGGFDGPITDAEGTDWSYLVRRIADRPGIPVALQKRLQDNIAMGVQDGNWDYLYGEVTRATADLLGGENATKFENAQNDLGLMQDLSSVIEEYKSMGGDMNLARRIASNTGLRFGTLLVDPKFAEISTQLDAVFQQYRQNMTGAAFGAQESAEYQRVRPSAKGSFELNEAVLAGASRYANSYVTSNIRQKMGEDGLKVKEKFENLKRGIQTPDDGLSDTDAWSLYQEMMTGSWTK